LNEVLLLNSLGAKFLWPSRITPRESADRLRSADRQTADTGAKFVKLEAASVPEAKQIEVT